MAGTRTEGSLRRLLILKKKEATSWDALSITLNLSPSYLHRVASGNAGVSDRLARALGYEPMEPRFREIER